VCSGLVARSLGTARGLLGIEENRRGDLFRLTNGKAGLSFFFSFVFLFFFLNLNLTSIQLNINRHECTRTRGKRKIGLFGDNIPACWSSVIRPPLTGD
jgi:hypothetical protein